MCLRQLLALGSAPFAGDATKRCGQRSGRICRDQKLCKVISLRTCLLSEGLPHRFLRVKRYVNIVAAADMLMTLNVAM